MHDIPMGMTICALTLTKLVGGACSKYHQHKTGKCRVSILSSYYTKEETSPIQFWKLIAQARNKTLLAVNESLHTTAHPHLNVLTLGLSSTARNWS